MDMNFRRGTAGALAGLTILSGALLSGCGNSKEAERIAELERQVANMEDLLRKSGSLGTDYDDGSVSEVGLIERSDYDFTEYAKNLYQETLNKDTYILRYAQVANVNWNDALALEVVELINGVYPTRMREMSAEDREAEMNEVLQAISLLIAGNLNPATKTEDVIDLSEYVVSEKDRTLMHNSLAVARDAVLASIGQPMEGKILDESQWARVNKFSKKYTGAVEKLLSYEYYTIDDNDFLEMNAGARFVIGTIFQIANDTIPQWSFVTIEASEYEPREHDQYYRWFFDEYEMLAYLPEPGKNGTTEYVCRDENCIEIARYTEAEMFAIAGLDYVAERRNTGITPNPNVVIEGIGHEVDNRVDEAIEQLHAPQKVKIK